MVDILHRIGIETPTPDKVYDALTTIDGLAGWWTVNTTGGASPGEVVKFRFADDGGADMKVVETTPNKRVLWEVVDGPAEWIGTEIEWDLRQDGDWTIVLFGHTGWREPKEFMYHCSSKWGSFLMSLKGFVESGAGAPWPQDVQISDWH